MITMMTMNLKFKIFTLNLTPTILIQVGKNPLYNAQKPSSCTVFLKQSKDDLYSSPLKKNIFIFAPCTN